MVNGDFISLSQFVSDLTNDVTLNVEGSVIVWVIVDLCRNSGCIKYTNQSTEKFTHCLDLLMNMPQK